MVYSVSIGATWKNPPCRRSSKAAKMLGESNRGAQNQSMVPSVDTSATVCKSPMSPCAAIGGYASIGTSP